jgi:pyrroloquinoline quinone biosynthesis protein E
LANRAALVPTRAQVAAAEAVVNEARRRLAGRIVIDYVVPDYYAKRAQTMHGRPGPGSSWTVTPMGKVLPCHAADSIPELAFDNIRGAPASRHLGEFGSFPTGSAAPIGCPNSAVPAIVAKSIGAAAGASFRAGRDAAATDPPPAGSRRCMPKSPPLADAESQAGGDRFIYRSYASMEAAGNRSTELH